MTYKIIQGDNREVLKTIEDNSIDAIVTDPPYGIDFLGKDWDANVGALETYQECLRVLKPGGHILAFSAARTYHHLAITLEQAGFEIRDQLMWIYSSGFPKSQDVGKSIKRNENKDNDWYGWGTSLKPGHEPIALARKPLKQSIIKNVQQWGTGALNIDSCRIGDFVATQPSTGTNVIHRELEGMDEPNAITGIPTAVGRFPSNVIGDIPDYQKYFYCPKVSGKERHYGFTEDVITEKNMIKEMGGYYIDDQGNKQDTAGKNVWLPQSGNIYVHGLKHEYELWCKSNGKMIGNVGNNHPTVKPVALMEYLIKLITPPGGTVLDPFNGSGSTGMAAAGLEFDYIGIELDPKYVEITEKRIVAWIKKGTIEETNNFRELFDGA